MAYGGDRTSYLHRAINRTRPRRLASNQATGRGEIAHPVGTVRTHDEHADHRLVHVEVRCDWPLSAYAASNTCRIERWNYRNRVHHPVVRYVAAGSDGSLLELAVLACGATLTNPWWLDEPRKICGDDGRLARICPTCEIRHHPERLGVTQPCAVLLGGL